MRKFLFFDIESCDGCYFDGSLCSFGYYLTTDKFEVIEHDDILVNPKPDRFKLGYGRSAAVQLAYTEAEFRRAPKFPKVLPRIAALFEGDVTAIGFAIDNDVKYLNGACDCYGLKRVEYKYFDVSLLYRMKHKLSNSRSLKDIVAELNIEFLAHRSDEDARVTMEVLKKLCEADDTDFDGIAKMYEIELGTNGQKLVKDCYCKAFLDGRSELKRGKKLIEGLVGCFDASLTKNENPEKSAYNKKYVVLQNEVFYADVDQTRRIDARLNELGASLSLNPLECDVFVYDKKPESAQLRYILSQRKYGFGRIKTVAFDDFVVSLGALPDIKFDNDSEVLVEYLAKQSALRNEENVRNFVSAQGGSTIGAKYGDMLKNCVKPNHK